MGGDPVIILPEEGAKDNGVKVTGRVKKVHDNKTTASVKIDEPGSKEITMPLQRLLPLKTTKWRRTTQFEGLEPGNFMNITFKRFKRVNNDESLKINSKVTDIPFLFTISLDGGETIVTLEVIGAVVHLGTTLDNGGHYVFCAFDEHKVMYHNDLEGKPRKVDKRKLEDSYMVMYKILKVEKRTQPTFVHNVRVRTHDLEQTDAEKERIMKKRLNTFVEKLDVFGEKWLPRDWQASVSKGGKIHYDNGIKPTPKKPRCRDCAPVEDAWVLGGADPACQTCKNYEKWKRIEAQPMINPHNNQTGVIMLNLPNGHYKLRTGGKEYEKRDGRWYRFAPKTKTKNGWIKDRVEAPKLTDEFMHNTLGGECKQAFDDNPRSKFNVKLDKAKCKKCG